MKYNVWIGGVCNTFNNKKDAMREYKHWIDKGYNDVILTKDNKHNQERNTNEY